MNPIFSKDSRNNIIVWFCSYACLPLSILLSKLKFSPNFLTFLSFVSMLFGCFYLIYENNLNFVIFFLLSIALDFCDGQVARIIKRTNKTKFRLDHNTDIIKITILYITFGVILDHTLSWVFIFVSNTLYILNNLLHEILPKENSKLLYKKSNFTFFEYFKLNKFLTLYKLLIPLILTFNTHSLFLILICLIDMHLIYYVFIYFNFIFIYKIVKNSYKLSLLNK